jgi:hypothetical protein
LCENRSKVTHDIPFVEAWVTCDMILSHSSDMWYDSRSRSSRVSLQKTLRSWCDMKSGLSPILIVVPYRHRSSPPIYQSSVKRTLFGETN